MVIHGHVEEVETEAGAALRAAAGLGEPGQDALAATLRDATEFLDVQVNQRARTGVLRPPRASSCSMFSVNYFCRSTTTILAGSPSVHCAAARRWCDNWGRRTRG